MLNKLFFNLRPSKTACFKLFALLLSFTLISASVTGQNRVSIKADSGIYPEGSVPILLRAGAVTTDPVFGTQIMRVTDSLDGPDFGTAYSYWPTFNKNNTRLLVQGSQPFLLGFDPTTFTRGTKTPFVYPPSGGGGTDYTSTEDAVWSSLDANNLFIHRGTVMYVLNTATMTYSVYGNLTSLLPNGAYIVQMSVSRNDDVFAFSVKLADYSLWGYAVWRKSTNSILYSRQTSNSDEVAIDKTGRYLINKTGNQGANIIEAQIIDLQANPVTVVDLTDNGPDFAPGGHADNGTGTIAGFDNWQNGITLRNFATPHLFKTILNLGNNWINSGGHLSFLADNEDWVLASSYATERSGAFNNEIYFVSTDGSQRVRRIAHHYSYYVQSYWDAPKANVSRDMRFVAFTSSWGDSGRRDLFIVKVPKLSLKPLEPGAADQIEEDTDGVKTMTSGVNFTPTTIVTKSKTGKIQLTNH